ncbi:MAG: thiol:disulfide interchange protein DsbA/DsbL [Burkholderiaceae bacterium]|nr:thiol:disulfide interchange protein DsbA/DsbL [Burkholderiaceae bacterium]
MNRREFGLNASLLALSGLAVPAWAQGGPVEGKDFLRVAQPVPVTGDKIEVVEFFGYWCPHCNAFEPALDAWVKRLPATVNFRRVPVAFNAAQEAAQRLYFGIEALGLVETLHRKVFGWIHVERKRIDKDADITAFAQASGTDPVKLLDASKSFSAATKVRQARQLVEGFRIEGVPTLGIQGRWMTSPSIAGSQERALATADVLIAQARKG